MAAEQVVDVNLTNFLVVFLMILIIQAIFAGSWMLYEGHFKAKANVKGK